VKEIDVTEPSLGEIESWLPVPGYEGLYEVSSLGRVKSIRILSSARLSGGYPSVQLFRQHEGRRFLVHRLVAMAFLGPRPVGQVVRHLNDVKTDNQLANLAYGTKGDNRRDAVRNGRDWNARKTHCDHDHEFDQENTYWRPDKPTNRQCRACAVDRDEERRPLRRRRNAALGLE
jgi:hypothetical protein